MISHVNSWRGKSSVSSGMIGATGRSFVFQWVENTSTRLDFATYYSDHFRSQRCLPVILKS